MNLEIYIIEELFWSYIFEKKIRLNLPIEKKTENARWRRKFTFGNQFLFAKDFETNRRGLR